MVYAGEVRINTGLETKDLQNELNNLASTITGQVSGIDLSIAGLSAGIIAMTKSAVEMGISFESAFTGVVKTVDATDAELAELRQGLLDLSNEIPVTANELAGIAESAGQLGIANEYILDFTEVMANLGVATNLTSEQAATDLARLANITQMSQTEFSNLGSSIVALGNNYATTESELTSMATRLAAAGAQANLSESDILGFAAAASSLGIEAEAGGTALSKVFTMIQTAVETGSESLDDYADVAGMTADAFVKAFQEDASGVITAFITGLGDVERTGKSATVILDELGITEIRLSNALKSLSGSGDLLTSAIELSNTAWEENTALTIEAETRYGTMESKIQDLQNGLTTMGITLYESVRDPIEAVVGVASSLIDGFNSLPDGIKETASQAIVLAGALGAAKTAMTAVNAAKEILNKLSTASAQASTAETAATDKGTQSASRLALAKKAAETATTQLTIAELAYKNAVSSGDLTGIIKANTALTEAKKNSATATKALSVAETESAVATTANATAQTFLSNALDKVTAAIAANPIAATTIAIAAVVKVVDALTVSMEEQVKKVQDLEQEYQTIKGEIDTLNTELKTTQSRIAELEVMDALTIIEESELETLQLSNKELETQILLKQRLADIGKSETDAEALKTLQKQVEVTEYMVDSLGRKYEYTIRKSMPEATEELIQRYRDLEAQQKTLTEQQNALAVAGDTSSSEFRALGTQLQLIGEQMEETDLAILEIAKAFQATDSTISQTTKNTQEYRDIVEGLPEALQEYIRATAGA